MDFDQYEYKARQTAIYPTAGPNLGIEKEIGLIYCSLGMSGESGEVAEHIKKMLRDDNGSLTKDRKLKLEKELGDVLWYIANMCHEIGTPMSYIAEQNINKLSSRKDRGRLHGSGDDR